MATNNAINTPIISFYANLSAPIANATGDGTQVNIICDTIVNQEGGSNFATGTGIFTCPISGYYVFTGNVSINPNASGYTNSSLSILKGATSIAYQTVARTAGGESNLNSYNDGTIVYCTAADQIKLNATAFGGTKTASITFCIFSGRFLGS